MLTSLTDYLLQPLSNNWCISAWFSVMFIWFEFCLVSFVTQGLNIIFYRQSWILTLQMGQGQTRKSNLRKSRCNQRREVHWRRGWGLPDFRHCFERSNLRRRTCRPRRKAEDAKVGEHYGFEDEAGPEVLWNCVPVECFRIPDYLTFRWFLEIDFLIQSFRENNPRLRIHDNCKSGP